MNTLLYSLSEWLATRKQHVYPSRLRLLVCYYDNLYKELQLQSVLPRESLAELRLHPYTYDFCFKLTHQSCNRAMFY